MGLGGSELNQCVQFWSWLLGDVGKALVFISIKYALYYLGKMFWKAF